MGNFRPPLRKRLKSYAYHYNSPTETSLNEIRTVLGVNALNGHYLRSVLLAFMPVMLYIYGLVITGISLEHSV